VGLVFGYREKPVGGGRIVDYQAIGPVLTHQGFAVQRRRVKLLVPDEGQIVPPPDQRRPNENHILAAEVVGLPPTSEEQLEIHVQGGELTLVRWAGKNCRKLHAPDINQKIPPEYYDGAIGVYCNNHTAIFRNAQLMLSKPER
jgi:hypothetical protein